jgi:drug/metabolite transporter (DMT)-like permease
VCVAVLPAAAGFAFGERLSGLALAGLLLAVCGVVLVSLSRGGRHDAPRPGFPARAIVIAVRAGTCLGAFFIVLSRTSSDSGIAPLVATRAVTLVAFGALAGWRVVRSGQLGSIAVPRSTLATAIAAGVTDMAGNAFYLVAVKHGPLAVIVVITALYPAVTVLLAKVTLGERMSVLQGIGTGAAIAAVGMLALSRT